jgi:hypothetical protein
MKKFALKDKCMMHTAYIIVFIAFVFYFAPNLFYFFFRTFRGNGLLVGFIVVVGIFDMKLAGMLAAIFGSIALYQLAVVGIREGATNKCLTGCKKPTNITGNCRQIADTNEWSCPYKCDNIGTPNQYSDQSGTCYYDRDCLGCDYIDIESKVRQYAAFFGLSQAF